MRTLASIVEESLPEYFRLRLVALTYDEGAVATIGTGTLLRKSDRLLILTCAHVASSFFKAPNVPPRRPLATAFRPSIDAAQVGREDLKLVESSVEPDLALIEVTRNQSRFEHMTPISAQDISAIPDFTALPKTNLDLFVCGFPAALATGDPRKTLELRPMALLTVVSPCTTKADLALKYDAASTGSGAAALPAPGGMSGALVWPIKSPEEGKIWSPGPAIAIQHAWRESKRILLCHRLDQFSNWLMSM